MNNNDRITAPIEALTHNHGPTAIFQAEFAARVIIFRERMETKEMEVNGEWLTEQKMKKSGDYSA